MSSAPTNLASGAPGQQKLAKATLTPLPKDPPPNGSAVTVHFNPASLVYSVENSVAQQSSGPNKVQYVAQFSAKLTMDLQFDTTDTGTDVRLITNQVANFMQASGKVAASNAAAAAAAEKNGGSNAKSAPAKAPPVLLFQWGTYQFQGVMDSFKETIDFFSADGVALRALVSIGLSRQDFVFDDSNSLSGTSTSGSLVPSSSGDSAQSLANRGGDPNAARQLAADNGLESMRFTGGATMQVNAGVQLNPPAAFATAPPASGGAGIGLGISGGAGIGISGGVSAGIGVGVSGGVSVSAQTSGLGAVFGGGASAGVPATAGAFAGLQVGRAPASSIANLNPLQMVPATVGSDVSTYPGACFSLGGAANTTGSAGLSTDVGANFSFRDRLTFSRDD